MLMIFCCLRTYYMEGVHPLPICSALFELNSIFSHYYYEKKGTE